MLTHDEVVELLRAGAETTSAEFKGPVDPDQGLHRAKVLRAIMAMANQRYGGHVIIGVDDDDPASMKAVLSEGDAAAWANYDVISAQAAAYWDPTPDFTLKRHELDNGTWIVVVEVREFATHPILCAKGCGDELQKGALYVRSKAPISSIPIETPEQMRELIDLAVSKQLRKFVADATSAGIDLSPATSPMDPFDAEVSDL